MGANGIFFLSRKNKDLDTIIEGEAKAVKGEL